MEFKCLSLIAIFSVLEIISGATLTSVELQKRIFRPANEVHEDIVAHYEAQIASLTTQITRNYKETSLKTSQLQTNLKKLVSDVVQDTKYEIEIVRDNINIYLRKPSNKDKTVKDCLELVKLNVNTLSTSALSSCYNSKTVSSLESTKQELLKLKDAVTVLVSACRKINPSESNAASMEKCLTDNLKTYETNLSNLVKSVTTDETAIKKTVNTCITSNSLESDISLLSNNAVKC